MRFLRGRDGFGEDENKYYDQSKETRNVESFESQSQFRRLLHQNVKK